MGKSRFIIELTRQNDDNVSRLYDTETLIKMLLVNSNVFEVNEVREDFAENND